MKKVGVVVTFQNLDLINPVRRYLAQFNVLVVPVVSYDIRTDLSLLVVPSLFPEHVGATSIERTIDSSLGDFYSIRLQQYLNLNVPVLGIGAASVGLWKSLGGSIVEDIPGHGSKRHGIFTDKAQYYSVESRHSTGLLPGSERGKPLAWSTHKSSTKFKEIKLPQLSDHKHLVEAFTSSDRLVNGLMYHPELYENLFEGFARQTHGMSYGDPLSIELIQTLLTVRT